MISFNNYPVRRAIPFIEQLDVDSAFKVEFTPSPLETNQMIATSYEIRRNLLIRFNNDEIDQTASLNPVLQERFPSMVALLTLTGNHLTPLGQDIDWKVGEVFTPFDAIGQWVKQGFSRDLNQLKQEILHWLNPVGFQ